MRWTFFSRVFFQVLQMETIDHLILGKMMMQFALITSNSSVDLFQTEQKKEVETRDGLWWELTGVSAIQPVANTHCAVAWHSVCLFVWGQAWNTCMTIIYVCIYVYKAFLLHQQMSCLFVWCRMKTTSTGSAVKVTGHKMEITVRQGAQSSST